MVLQTEKRPTASVHLLPAREYLVAHFDMLGVTHLLKQNFDLACAFLGDLYEAPEEDRYLVSPVDWISVRVVTFSDTVILYRDFDDRALGAIVARSLGLFRAAFTAGLPVRGGIASGRMLVREEPPCFFGEALAKAYALGESQRMLGVSVEDALARRFLDAPAFEFVSGADVLVPWSTPVHPDERIENRYVLNWPALGVGADSISDPASLYGKLALQPETSYAALPVDVRQKYENTHTFLSNHLPTVARAREQR